MFFTAVFQLLFRASRTEQKVVKFVVALVASMKVNRGLFQSVSLVRLDVYTDRGIGSLEEDKAPQ